MEYDNPHCKAQHKGRFFKKPDAKDLARVAEAERRLQDADARFVPDQEILPAMKRIGCIAGATAITGRCSAPGSFSGLSLAVG